ncbi:MAG: zinc ribbon domain-containing protein [Anaerolineaceae bacterium]|nr:zinc ribbon domain-containing protein [Anaerolineaceae bacterium]
MPLYVYRCETCTTTFEKLVRFSQAGQSQVCPQCQSHDTHKQITSAASRSAGTSGARPASSPFT